MPKSPSFPQYIELSRSSLLSCVAIVLAVLALGACQQGAGREVEPIADRAAAVDMTAASVALDGPNSSGGDDDDDDDDDDECLVPGPFQKYFPGEKAFVFKSTPNAAFPYYDPSVCNSAPFVPTISSGGRMTSVLYRLDKAKVGDAEQEEVGYGTLCIKIQDFTFTPFGAPLLAYGQIQVNNMSITVNGTCTVTNSGMPVAGVAQMACALPLVAPIPEGHVGGLLTTNSVLNLAGVPGYSGGSILALHLYKTPDAPPPVQLLPGVSE